MEIHFLALEIHFEIQYIFAMKDMVRLKKIYLIELHCLQYIFSINVRTFWRGSLKVMNKHSSSNIRTFIQLFGL